VRVWRGTALAPRHGQPSIGRISFGVGESGAAGPESDRALPDYMEVPLPIIRPPLMYRCAAKEALELRYRPCNNMFATHGCWACRRRCARQIDTSLGDRNHCRCAGGDDACDG
jgi:hypothetical protein